MFKLTEQARQWGVVVVLLGTFADCSTQKGPSSVTASKGGLTTTNGLMPNGLTTNGLASNGLWYNGLWYNGLWYNGLWYNGAWEGGLSLSLWTSSTWSTTLTGDARVPGDALRSNQYLRQLLTYVYSCAMPASESAIIDPNDGALTCSAPTDCDNGYSCVAGKCVVSLTGKGGLAINENGTNWWTSGTCDESCQRWISACVLARTNAFGVHVEISMRAPADAPQAIKDALAVTDADGPYMLREGAYYGNIFATKPTTPSPAGGSGPATGPVASAPVFYACAGPNSNIPELTKRFCSSQGDQSVINVPGVCLGTSKQGPVCEGVDAAGAIRDCHTASGLQGPSYKEVITVYLQQPMAVCGNGVCEAGEDPACPSDCHPGTWAKSVAPGIAGSYSDDQYYGTSAAPEGLSAVAPDGSIVVAGTVAGDVDLGGGPLSAAAGNGILAKYNSDGTYAWGVRFGNNSQSAAGGQLQQVTGVGVAANGNITVMGLALESVPQVTFDDIWVSTYSPTGALISTGSLQVGLTNGLTLNPTTSVAVDSQGNAIVGGYYGGQTVFGNSGGGQNSYFAKISPAGSLLWSVNTQKRNSNPKSVAVDAADDVVTLDPDQGVTKWSSAGAMIWQQGLSGYGDEVVGIDGTGNVYVGGFDGSGLGTYNVGTVPVLKKYDSSGVIQWTRNPQNPCPTPGPAPTPDIQGCSNTMGVHGKTIGFTPAGDVVLGVVGNPFHGGFDFGVGGLLPTYNAMEIFLAAYSPAGVPTWAKEVPMILRSSLLSMAIDTKGHLVLGGNYSGSMLADGRLLVTDQPEDPDNIDSFLASFMTPSTLDTTPPTIGGTTDSTGITIDTVPAPMVVQATSAAGATVFFMPPTATDSGYAGTNVSCVPAPNTTFSIGTTTVTCTASDPVGNHVSKAFTVTVVDTLGPVISPGVDITVAATGAAGAVISYAPPTATDQVDGPRPVTCAPASGTLFAVGKQVVTCSASDARGNPSSMSFSVTVTPSATPVSVTCLGTRGMPIVVQTAPGNCGASVSAASVGACTGGTAGLASCLLDGLSTETLGPGNHAVTLVATGLDGSTATCTSSVTVQDGQNPAINCPSQTVACTGGGGATVTPVATCTDNCSCTASCVTGKFPVGLSSGTCAASDPSGNSAACQPTITVVDAVAPVVTPLSGPTQLQCNAGKWSDPGATALDQCVGDVSSTVRVSGTVDPKNPGSYTETYSASDPSGNVGTATRLVQVVDTVAPATIATTGPSGTPNRLITITVTSYTVTPSGGGTPIAGSATCWSTAGVAVGLTATDGCALKQLTYSLAGAQTGGATVSGGTASFTVTRNGTTTVTYGATDKAGNVEVSNRLPLVVESVLGLSVSCAPAPSLKGLPAHGNVSIKGTLKVTDSRTGKQTSQPFSLSFSY